MINKVYYYKLNDSAVTEAAELTIYPYGTEDLEDFLDKLYIDTTDLTAFPYNIASDTDIQLLWQEVVATYLDEYVIKIVKPFEENVTNEDIIAALQQWAFRFLNLIVKTGEYYKTLLGVYSAAKTHLMDDITATSRNRVKFNDTPQNTNASGTYEGDNYITHFTSTEGENSSPLMSKMMRLKEIQESYHNVMADWVKKFQALFIEEANV